MPVSNTSRFFMKSATFCAVTALTLGLVPAPFTDGGDLAAWAQGQGQGGAGGSGGGSDGDRGQNRSGSGASQGSGSGGGTAAPQSGSENAGQGGGSANAAGRGPAVATDGGAPAAPAAPGTGADPASGGQMQAEGNGPSFGDIMLEMAGESDDSDRPDWAGEPGGKDGAGGGQPPTSGTMKGDLFGDLFIIVRDENGVPVLTPEGWVQPLDAEGNLIPLDDEGHPIDESLTVEVELGRLNVSRAPVSVLENRADEVITMMLTATDVTTDAAGRLVFTVDGVEKTIDSPLENLAIYKSLMTTGTIAGVDDLPGTEFDYLVDGQLTAADLAASAAFLAAATDKTGAFTSDEIAYLNAFLDVNTVTVGSVIYSNIDYSDFTYSRESTYQDVEVEVLILQDDGSWVPTVVNVYDAVFGGEAADGSGTLDAYTIAADDARSVVNFIHEYAIPAEALDSITH